jgi:hypothetical protein
MRFVPNAVTRAAARQVLLTQKNSPTILFGVGVVGAVAATVLACRATLKLNNTIDDIHKEKLLLEERIGEPGLSDDDHKRDMAFFYIRTGFEISKMYAPAVALGAFSIGCLGGSHHILTKRNAGLTAAYAAVDKAFKDYRRRVVDEYGQEKDLELRHGVISREHTTTNKKGEEKVKTVKSFNPSELSGYARHFDQTSPEWQREPTYNAAFLRAKQQYLNDMLQSRGYVFLNEAYRELGIPQCAAGQAVGWVLGDGGDNYVDFGIFNLQSEAARAFVNGLEASILLDFNVDGVIIDKVPGWGKGASKGWWAQ